jgi:outer membrane protein OmpA-like peptidoglycan-associated protein/tetratricopeptide (TPR) repeat protein
MQKKVSLLFFFIFLAGISVTAQDLLLKKANSHYENLAYNDAITLFEQVIETGTADSEVYQKLGDSYYYNSDLKNALKSYQKMIEIGGNVPAEYYARTASALKNSNNFKGADKLLKELRAYKANDSRAVMLSDVPNYLRDIEATSGRYALENIEVNSEQADFAPTFYLDELVFSSARENNQSSNTQDKWTGNGYLTLVKSTINENGQLNTPELLSKKLDALLHESTAAFTKDGKTVYFTRNNLEGIGFKTDTTGLVRLQILRADKDEYGIWRNIKELLFNDDSYSVAHPALSVDESELYFASDMPGTHGMSDIYKVDINPDGSYGKPINMGTKINTEGRETFPFVSKKGALYFSSDGHQGLGGLDVFATGKVLRDRIINVGRPINGPADDMTFIIDDDNGKGYLASNRDGGKGDDDLYAFTEELPLIGTCYGNFFLTVVDEATGEPLNGSLVEMKNPQNEVIVFENTDKDGRILSNFECGDIRYNIKTIRSDYMTKSQIFNASWNENKPTIEVKLKSIAPKIGSDIIDILELMPVYYEYNSTEILKRSKPELDKIVTYLKNYPKVHLKLIAHSDSRGEKPYNLRLSGNRASSVASYLIANGIEGMRLLNTGKGEDNILNKCVDGVECQEEEHVINRRTEFIITKK